MSALSIFRKISILNFLRTSKALLLSSLLIDTLASLYITSCFLMVLSYNWPNNNTANITISKAKN